MWRLTQTDTLRRSLSRSPTSDMPTRIPSPSPSSSVKPSSSVVLRPKKTSTPLQADNQLVNLRRSGTYDLLNDDVDDVNADCKVNLQVE